MEKPIKRIPAVIAKIGNQGILLFISDEGEASLSDKPNISSLVSPSVGPKSGSKLSVGSKEIPIVGVAVGRGVEVGAGVAVGDSGAGVSVAGGATVGVGAGVLVGVGVGVGKTVSSKVKSSK